MSSESASNATFTFSYTFIPTKQHRTGVDEAWGLKVQSPTVLVPIPIYKLGPITFPSSPRDLATIRVTSKLIIIAATIQRPQITFCHSSVPIRDFCREQPSALWSEGFSVSHSSGVTVPTLELQDAGTPLVWLMSAVARCLILHSLVNQHLHTTHESNMPRKTHICYMLITSVLDILKNQ